MGPKEKRAEELKDLPGNLKVCPSWACRLHTRRRTYRRLRVQVCALVCVVGVGRKGKQARVCVMECAEDSLVRKFPGGSALGEPP